MALVISVPEALAILREPARRWRKRRCRCGKRRAACSRRSSAPTSTGRPSTPPPWTATPSGSRTSGARRDPRRSGAASWPRATRPAPRCGPGEAVRVMTGAPLPPGTEAVVPVEEIQRQDGTVIAAVRAAPRRARAAPRRERHRGNRAAAARDGASRRPTSRWRRSPERIRCACERGRASRSPSPATSSSRPRRRPGPGQLRDSNGPMLAALCAARGCAASLAPAVADEDAAVRRLFREAGRGEDVLLTSGGVSAGDLDLLPERAAKAGFEILFHGVAMRPGQTDRLRPQGRDALVRPPRKPGLDLRLFSRVRSHRSGPAGGRRSRRARLRDRAADPGDRGQGPAGDLPRRDAWRSPAARTASRPLESRGSHDLAAHARANALIRIPRGRRAPGGRQPRRLPAAVSAA